MLESIWLVIRPAHLSSPEPLTTNLLQATGIASTIHSLISYPVTVRQCAMGATCPTMARLMEARREPAQEGKAQDPPHNLSGSA